MNFGIKGSILVETLLTTLVWGALVATAHFAVIKFWNKRLLQLDETRLYYDGMHP